jgi:hypothetical protein
MNHFISLSTSGRGRELHSRRDNEAIRPENTLVTAEVMQKKYIQCVELN